jgi:hypothetical protein
MSLHDTYARLTPWELTFQTPEKAETLSRSVAEEAEGRGADADEPHAFVTMGAVGAFVADLEGPDPPAGSIHQFGALTFHGVHFTRAGCPLFLLSTHVARYLVGGAPDAVPTPPTPAGYLQLPQHLFWADGGSGTPESVDGLFWTVTKRDVMHTLLVTGLRPDRPGIGVIPLPEAPLGDAGAWLDADAREGGTEFDSHLPGSELDGLHSLVTAGEALKLLARFFAYLSAVPASAQPHEPGSVDSASAHDSPDAARGPTPSRLPFTRVVLDA